MKVDEMRLSSASPAAPARTAPARTALAWCLLATWMFASAAALYEHMADNPPGLCRTGGGAASR